MTNLYIAQEDAAQVSALTKSEMIEFYSTYIAPISPTRAKLVVNLVAQSSNPESKENATTNGEETVPTNGTVPVAITDVRDFKASLVASPGACPVRNLSEFEEIDSKL